MRPAFTRALYYPFIDIQNSDWLKTAVLFWDSLSTIVPVSYRNPYNHYHSEYLADIGFLQPYYVYPEHTSVVDIEEDIINILHSPEFLRNIAISNNRPTDRIFDEKMSFRIRKELELYMLYPDKISHKLNKQLRPYYQNGVFHLDSCFAYAYMLTLANKICEDQSIALVTDDVVSANCTSPIRLGTQAAFTAKYRGHRHRERLYEQGLLLDLIVRGLSIVPDTSLSDVIQFKERHKDELGLFRTKLAKLTENVSTNTSIDALQQEIHDIYLNEFLPAFNNFKAALKSSGIRWIADNFLKVSLFSVGATSVPIILGLAAPQALLAGAGVSLLASSISYNVDKKEKLRENPYSYLLAAERELV